MNLINPWDKYRLGYWDLLKSLFKKPSEKEEEILLEVKLHILNYIVRLGILVGSLSLLTGLIFSYQITDIVYGVFITVIYLSLLVIWLIPGDNYKLKSNLLLLSIFALSTFLLLNFGPDSPTILWYFTTIITATILHGSRGSVISIVILTVSMLSYIIFSQFGIFTWHKINFSLIELIAITFDLIFLSSVISVSLLLLIRGLTNALIISKESKEKLTEQIEIAQLAINSLREEIADRIVIEEELINSERRLKNVQSITKISSWELDINKTTFRATEEFFDIIGMPNDTQSISFIDFEELCYVDDLPTLHYVLNALFLDSDSFDIKFRIRHVSSNEIRWVRYIGGLEKEPTGKAIRISGTMQDITQDMILQQGIIQSEAQFRALFDNASIAILLLDENQFVDCNPNAEKLFGLTREQLIGKSPEQLSPPFQNNGFPSKEAAADFIRRAYDGESLVFEWKHLKNASEPVDVEVSLSRIKLRDTYVLQAFLIDITDRKVYERTITEVNKELELRVADRTKQLETALEELKYENEERKRTQEELIKTQDDLLTVLSKEKLLNELRSRFISMVSHEYRTPLTVILSSTYILDKLFEKDDEESFKKNLDLIRHSIQSLTKLLDDVLVFEKPTSKDWQMTFSTIELVSFIKSVVDEMKLTLAKNRIVNIQSTNNKIVMECDQSSMRYIISNLIANAIKYSQDDTSVDISIVDNQTAVSVRIKDYGIGIPENEKENVFDPFHRSRNVGNTPGTGLGLAIVKRYVDLMNGSISFESTEGKGSTFKLKFEK